MGKFRFICVALASVMLLQPTNSALAETLNQALALAYSNNPTINAARAGLRVTDEGVAIAKSGMRPSIEGTGSVAKNWVRGASDFRTGSFGIEITQTLYDGLRTKNAIYSSKSAVKADRENLRNTEINVLLDAASVYMDVIRDTAILGYRKQAIEFLNEQVRSERTRFDVGESTRTDVALAEGRRAAALAQLSAARAALASSKAVYRQIIGKEPGKLYRPKGIYEKFPRSANSAIGIAFQNHPSILAARHRVDQALYNVKHAEGALLPRVSLSGSATHTTHTITGNTDTARVAASLTVPIYQGGEASATVRQRKETLGQNRILIDEIVDRVRQLVVSAYSQLDSAKGSVSANKTQLGAAQLALRGAVEERRVGQRTTLDVLNTQQDVLTAQVSLAQAERSVVVASYAILSSIGSLSAGRLGLGVSRYDPEEHYEAVKDKWYGLRTPNGQ